jgi:hypothetical protein
MITDAMWIAAVYAAVLVGVATLLPRYALELIAIAAMHGTVVRARSFLSV